MFDGAAFGQEVVTAVKAHLDKHLVPVIARLDAIERELEQPAPVGLEHLHAVKSDIESLRKAISDGAAQMPDLPLLISEAVAAIPAAENGKDADPEMIRAMVATAVAALPPARDGKDADPEQVAALVASEAERILAGWERPQDGKSVTVEELTPLVNESVQRAVAAVPAPKDGRDGKDGINGKDGLDVMELMIDADGNLVGVMSNGTTKSVGPVKGKDGAPGLSGKDGADGLGFEDMDFIDRDDGFYIAATKGGVTKEKRLPIVRDCGMWKEGSVHRPGDGVTWAGHFWICQEETIESPDKARDGKPWRMAVRKGRDGKDATAKI